MRYAAAADVRYAAAADVRYAAADVDYADYAAAAPVHYATAARAFCAERVPYPLVVTHLCMHVWSYLCMNRCTLLATPTFS